jgi:hypothetical protein
MFEHHIDKSILAYLLLAFIILEIFQKEKVYNKPN